MKGKHIRAWHFCNGNELRGGQKLVVGKTYSVEGELVMCERGLHWSRRILDALQYAPGFTICLVEAWGDVQEQDDKGVSRYRKVIAKIEGEKVLRLFACDVAEQALTKAKVTDKRSWNAIEVARLYANGKATKTKLAAARAAAWAAGEAAREAAWAAGEAARAAAREAALAAAREAARAAAREAALAAAREAARAAAWEAALAAAREAALAAREAAREAALAAAREAALAARAAARAAAWEAALAAAWEAAGAAAREAALAARDEQNTILTSLVLKAMKCRR